MAGGGGREERVETGTKRIETIKRESRFFSIASLSLALSLLSLLYEPQSRVESSDKNTRWCLRSDRWCEKKS